MNICRILCVLLCNFSVLIYAETFLVFGGKTGWIGQQLISYLQKIGHTAIAAHARLEQRQEIIAEIELHNPDFIINAAGITGRPNVDWCETHKDETMRANLWGPLNLASVAYAYHIHVTNISTGCIYKYDEQHPMRSGKGFTEEDKPNFTGSFYSKCKVALEEFIVEYPNVLNLRLRMPISDTLTERAFIGKIIQYKQLINIPNSMAIIDDIIPAIIQLTLKQCHGIYNLVNPGTISHDEIMQLYKKYIDPTHEYSIASEEVISKLLKAPRSNCELDASKLLQECPDIPHIQQSIIHVFERMKEKLKK